jgi:uncharacterized protein (TIGR02246 family)
MPSPWPWLAAIIVCVGAISIAHSADNDEQVIRKMVMDAVNRMNGGDTNTIRDFWDVDADYVSVDGRLIRGRAAMEEFLIPIIKAGAGKVTQQATIEHVRFLTSDLAIVDGSWTITGARDAAGKELPPLRGRGVEVAQRKNGRWLFVATREMVIWRGSGSP